MGREKGSIRVDGVTLAQSAARRLEQVCDSVCISIAHNGVNPAPGFPVIEDPPGPQRGPLGALAAVFRAVGERDLLVLACDYPRVRVELLRSILAFSREHGGLTMAAGRRDHPLVALWHRSLSVRVDEALNSGALRVRDLVARVPVLRVDDERSGQSDQEWQLINVNRPEDLAGLDVNSSE